MKPEYVKSSPYFFRRIKIALILLVAVICVLSVFIGAPLQEPAEPHNVPNPSKSAWFLLWMQELVSYNLHFVYLIVIMYIAFILMPFFIKPKEDKYAKWFDRRFAVTHIITIIALILIIGLTVLAYFFRVEYWQLAI